MICPHAAGLVYLDELTMRCVACGDTLPRIVKAQVKERPPEPEERIADALEDIARSLRKIAYPDQWLVPSERPEQSIACSLELLATCVEVGGDLPPRLRTS